MAQLEHIEAIEKRLWSAADTLRANSNYASNEYFLPVMGLIFLRHAYSRYLTIKAKIEPNLPKRGGHTRPLTKEDFSRESAIYLQPQAQFDHLVALSEDQDRAQAIIDAMESIEKDYENLKGVLPKNEYKELDNEVLGELLRTLNPEELKKVSGDVFGRIYEYFLTQFADQKAHDGGEFFTPVSLVSLIAHVINPEKGIILDPACGSGGMFVQSAKVVESRHQNPSEKLTFYGLEKNATTIRLAKMNLAVHGLEGNINKAITYYEEPHHLTGKADFVMANPPFNVDEIDEAKVKNDKERLPFGLPGVNKKKKISNGNYIWISYFYSFLNEQGRAGFVMSSQASSAGRDEAKVRQKLIESGSVDIMIAIRSNFFYTRTVPCELWFLDRNKPKQHKDKVLMIDARQIYRKVTRKIFDFSPEQENNLLAIVSLYKGQTSYYLDVVGNYCHNIIQEAEACFKTKDDDSQAIQPLPQFIAGMKELLPTLTENSENKKEITHNLKTFEKDSEAFNKTINEQKKLWQAQKKSNGALKQAVDRLSGLGETSRDLVKQTDLIYKLISNTEGQASRSSQRNLKEIDQYRQIAVEQLKQVRYFWKQAHWLTGRFPEAKLQDVEGLVKLVDHKTLASNDWSLTPGRYVGVAPEEEDENFDFEETMREIHVELEDLNQEANKLAKIIKKNFEELGI